MNKEKEEMGEQLVDWDDALGEMRKQIKKRQCQESGSDGDSTKKSRIDAKNSEQSDPKKAANMASRSFDNVL
ncbi:hypothetical protein Ddc_18229 [Ditylenchus destructor]|nr:hypothetical protein Ddc_18229 [Ditylenchus destructor]